MILDHSTSILADIAEISQAWNSANGLMPARAFVSFPQWISLALTKIDRACVTITTITIPTAIIISSRSGSLICHAISTNQTAEMCVSYLGNQIERP